MSLQNLTMLSTACIVLSGASLLLGWYFIRVRRAITAHRNTMLSATALAALFLVFYVIYHANVGSKPFPGHGAIRAVYLTILFTHVVLAAVILPMALVTARRGLRGRFDRHVPLARWTLPLWMYVSVTGVVIYVMLYQLY